jgi:cellulose synthase/poly-beta-1,6-N-acetylglucosamine synthase-like glycosyltransferase
MNYLSHATTKTLQKSTGFPLPPVGGALPLTVGICALDELETTAQLVKVSLLDATRSDLRVVVVTPSLTIARSLEGKDDRIRVIVEDSREGKTSAMNRMLNAIRDGIVVYASADSIIEDGTISALVDTLIANPSCGAVIAHVDPLNKLNGIMGSISSIIWELFNRVNTRLDEEKKLSQANDLYVFWRNLVDEIPRDTINDDTYIASTIRKRGFLVKKTRAKVLISGPTTPLDYVIQRSRIILGHLQTIRTQRLVPSVFEFTLFSSPLRNLRMLTSTIASGGVKHCFASIIASQLELTSWVCAMIMSLFKSDVRIWKVAAGTKLDINEKG